MAAAKVGVYLKVVYYGRINEGAHRPPAAAVPRLKRSEHCYAILGDVMT